MPKLTIAVLAMFATLAGCEYHSDPGVCVNIATGERHLAKRYMRTADEVDRVTFEYDNGLVRQITEQNVDKFDCSFRSQP